MTTTAGDAADNNNNNKNGLGVGGPLRWRRFLPRAKGGSHPFLGCNINNNKYNENNDYDEDND